MRSWTSCSRCSGAASASSDSTALRRFSIDAGVRGRPRRGRFWSSASRYARTARPSARPWASARLCSAVIVLFRAAAIRRPPPFRISRPVYFGIGSDSISVTGGADTLARRRLRRPSPQEPEPCDGDQGGTVEPLHRQLGLTDDELASVVELLGRDPTDLELAMFAVMWSEHCSYKSSRAHLRGLPTEAPWVLVGPGEGAGVVDVGDGLAVALRIESHNHPSAVEPYQGAATGVGGIIRDIFSMGARPIALMDPLRFGPLDDARTRYMFEGVVSGISGYGNAVGVPTVGGEVVFDDCYRENPLVNVLCLGLLPHDRLVLARARGAGNLAVLLGSSTGRDGIGGASVLASAGFEEGAEEKRPSVQVGDPLEEKKLIEACLALLDAGLAVGVQDLGAAGLSCAASETAAKAGAGMDVDAARVSKREPGMNPVEVLTSESQERMLAIVTPDDLDEVLALCERWEIRATVVGRVTDSARFRVYDGLFDAIGVPGANPPPPIGDAPRDVTADRLPDADVPVGSLGDGPLYHRPLAPPADLAARQADDPARDLLAQ